MSKARSTGARGTRGGIARGVVLPWEWALALLCAAAGCGEPEATMVESSPGADVGQLAAVEAGPVEPAAVEVEPTRAAPPPANQPAPDPEAIARAREEAARARFEAEYPLHGVAYHFLAQVHRRADGGSPVVGYMRRGAQFRAQTGLRGPGCPRGWHRVPGDGFVCRGNGFALGESPQTFDPSPVSPVIDGALPYAYTWVARDDVPQYWRLPTREEETIARDWISRRRAEEERLAASAAASTASTAAASTPDDTTADTLEDAEGEPQPDLEAPPGLEGDADAENVEVAVDAGVPEAAAPADDEMPSFLRMRMRRGFYVSIDRLEVVDGRRFYRTIRGAYVPADAVTEATPPTMRGVVLGGRWSLPLGFVFRGGVRGLTREPARGVLQMADALTRNTPYPLQSDVIVRTGRRYRVSDRGNIIREDALRIATALPRPAGIPDGARWIHVDLARQVLVAYEDTRPVFATMVATGREGYATPTGTFQIQSKHVSTTMDDPNAGEEAYSIEDVPWTMYFEGSYALHAAFWHDRFGRVRSHGCVNLAPADARWLFTWSEPAVPPGWHGISTGGDRAGTWVHITAGE